MPIEVHPFRSGKWQANLPPLGPQWFANPICFGYMPSMEVQNLFLGSFPAYEVVNLNRHRGNKEFFYGSVDSNFWPVLSALTGLPVGSEADCMSLLRQTRYGVTDILKEVNRNGTSCKDSDLTALHYNDLLGLLTGFPNVTTLFVTSGGKSPILTSTGNCVSKWLRDYFVLNGYTCKGFNTKGYRKQLTIVQNEVWVKQLNLIALLSPSDQAWQSMQAIINRHNLQPLLAAVPAQFFPPGTDKTFNRLRLLQWGYHLSACNFPVQQPIQLFIAANFNRIQSIFI